MAFTSSWSWRASRHPLKNSVVKHCFLTIQAPCTYREHDENKKRRKHNTWTWINQSFSSDKSKEIQFKREIKSLNEWWEKGVNYATTTEENGKIDTRRWKRLIKKQKLWFWENHKICKSESFTVIFRCRFRFFLVVFVPLWHSRCLRLCVHIELSL